MRHLHCCIIISHDRIPSLSSNQIFLPPRLFLLEFLLSMFVCYNNLLLFLLLCRLLSVFLRTLLLLDTTENSCNHNLSILNKIFFTDKIFLLLAYTYRNSKELVAKAIRSYSPYLKFTQNMLLDLLEEVSYGVGLEIWFIHDWTSAHFYILMCEFYIKLMLSDGWDER